MSMSVFGAIAQAGDVATDQRLTPSSEAEASVATSIVGNPSRSLVLVG